MNLIVQKQMNNSLNYVSFNTIGMSTKKNISALKEYLGYTSTNTPPPPLNNVPKRGFSS